MEDFSRKPLIKGEQAVQGANAWLSTYIERSLAVALNGLYCFSQHRSPNIFPLLIANC
jgi:hypothetical protein